MNITKPLLDKSSAAAGNSVSSSFQMKSRSSNVFETQTSQHRKLDNELNNFQIEINNDWKSKYDLNNQSQLKQNQKSNDHVPQEISYGRFQTSHQTKRTKQQEMQSSLRSTLYDFRKRVAFVDPQHEETNAGGAVQRVTVSGLEKKSY